MNNCWTSVANSDSLYLSTLKSMEQNQYVVVLESALIRRYSVKDVTAIKDYLVCTL